jgi:hypothetical protein
MAAQTSAELGRIVAVKIRQYALFVIYSDHA